MSGRSEEFREFARDRGWPLQQTAYLLCGDWHAAQDVVQETLIKAYRHWPRVKRAGNPDAYVRGILLNEVRARWGRPDVAVPGARAPPRHPAAPPPHFAAEPAVPDASDDIARRDRLRQALLELPLQQRMTVVLRYLEDQTQVETAKLLGCSEGTVKSQSSRALGTLRTFLTRTESKL
jgi:RNA polymerase sigma-70 factor (sigma-E family)